MVEDHQNFLRKNIKRHNLEETPLLFTELDEDRIWIFRQKISGNICFISRHPGGGSTSIHPKIVSPPWEDGYDGGWGAGVNDYNQYLFGYLPPETVTISLNTEHRVRMIMNTSTGVFLVVTSEANINICFIDNEGHTLKEINYTTLN